MPQATSPSHDRSPRRYHPASQSSRPRRPVHPPNAPPHREVDNHQEMATASSSTRSSHSYWNPGPYAQPGRSNSVPNILAPPPHILPLAYPQNPLLPNRPLPQWPAPDPNRGNMDSLAEAALVRSRDTEDTIRLRPTVTKINFSEPPTVPGGLPQYPPGSTRPNINMSFTAPHQVPRRILHPPDRDLNTWSGVERIQLVPPPKPLRPADEVPFDPHPSRVKPRKRQFGEVNPFQPSSLKYR
jgi:hypothetical protein